MSSAPPRIIRVTAAVIEKDGQILCAQRPQNDALAGLWEFPGGKIEPGEAPEACLQREIQEELGLEIVVGSLLCKTLHDYPGKTIELHVYRCRLTGVQQTPSRLESHQAIQWLSPKELPKLSWAPADLEAVSLLAQA